MSNPPLVRVSGLVMGAQEIQEAALLSWGRWRLSARSGSWAAGIAFLWKTWHDRALVTMWVPAAMVEQRSGVDYSQVPRVELAGPPEAWPVLPARYPHATQDWITSHRHLVFGQQ
jgi:hypothetical protein